MTDAPRPTAVAGPAPSASGSAAPTTPGTAAPATATPTAPARVPIGRGPFWRVWAGQAAGAVGDQLLPVVLALYVLARGGQVTEVGLVLGGRALALVVFLILGGLLADRCRRVRILIAGDLGRGVLLLGLALALPVVPLAVLPLVTLIAGSCEALSRPAMRAVLPDLVRPAALERANGLLALAHRSSAALGALGAVAAVSVIGPRPTLLLVGTAYLLAAIAVLGLREPARTAAADPDRRGLLSDLTTGLRAVRDRPWAAAVMVAVGLQLLCGTAPALTLLPVIASSTLGGPAGYGAAVAAMALGALPAVALTDRWRPARPGGVSMGLLVLYALVPLSLFAALVWVGPLAGPVAASILVVGCFAVGGFVVGVYGVYWMSALARRFPSELWGRVFALDQTCAYALLPLGFALTGPVAGLVGPAAVLLGGGMLTGLAALAALAVPGVARLGEPVPDRAAQLSSTSASRCTTVRS